MSLTSDLTTPLLTTNFVGGIVDKYFWQPIVTDSGYNLVNSITYALVAILALFFVYKLLKKLKVRVDRRFFYALLPFIFFGSTLRAFVDSGVYQINFWTVSPGIYILVASVFLLSFVVSTLAERYTKLKYWRLCAGVGVFATILLLAQNYSKLEFTNLKFGLVIIGLTAGASVLLYLIFSSLKLKWCLKECGFLPFASHMLDATTAFIAVDFLGMVEKHPVPNFFVGLAGTASVMYILKLLILLPAVYLLHREIESENLRNFLLIAIATLGLAEGLRNLITIILV